MKTMVMKTVAAFGIAIMVATGASAQAGGARGNNGSGDDMDFMKGADISMKLVRALDNKEFVALVGLSDAQVSRLKDMAAAQKDAREQHIAAIKPLMEELKEAMQSDSPNISSVESLIERIGYERTESQKSAVVGMLEMKAVLTADQLATVKEIVQQYSQKRMGENAGSQKGFRSRRDKTNTDQ